MNTKDIVLAVGLAIVLTAGTFFYVGWYNWEFKRPPTAVYHNQYINGTNATVTQNTQDKPKDKWWSFGIYAGNHKSYGGIVTIYP